MVNRLHKKRIVIWPKGSLLFNTNFSAVPLYLEDQNQEKCEDWDSVTLALRLLYYRFHHKKSRIIGFEEWRKIAVQKMRLSPHFSTVIFLTAQAVLPLQTAQKWSSVLEKDHEKLLGVNADLLAVVAVVAMLGCRKRTNAGSIVQYLKKHMDQICWLLLLCHYDLAVQHILSQNYTRPLLNQLLIPTKALAQLDVLFEGTLLVSSEILSSSANIIPQTCSSLLHSMPQLKFSQLCDLLSSSLQADMFLLDVDERVLQPIKSVRSITSTQFAEHRKISVRQWLHMELLTSIQYAGSNLRMMHAHHTVSPVFHLRWLRSAAIVDCSNVGVLVLGPVQQMLVLKRVKKATVSVVCARIWLEQCEDIQLFVNCECAVTIVEKNCRSIQLAPYNVFYDGLVYELDKADMLLMDCCKNTWDKPVVLKSTYSSNASQTPSPASNLTPCWSLLPTHHFYIQPTPFRATNSFFFYKTFLASIPSHYQQQWFESTRPRAVQSTLKQDSMNYEVNKQFLRDHMPFTNTDLSYLLRRVERKK